MKGFKVGKNQNNGFAWIQLHYTADPKKRSTEWKKQAMFGMDYKAWMTEMELSWEVYAGEPVYGREFAQAAHVLETRREPVADYPMLMRGWDFGGNHSCIVAQYIRGRLYILDEYANMGYNTRVIAKDVVEDCNLRYGPDYHYVDVIDPSGMWEGKTSTGLACADVMNELGMHLVPGIQEPTKRVDAVMKLLVSLREGTPCLMINPGCRMLIDGFLGGYHYPERETKNQKRNRPEKNEYSHIHDALQYVCTRLESGHTETWDSIDIEGLGNLEFDL